MKRFGLSVLVLFTLGPVIAGACFAQAPQSSSPLSSQQQAQTPPNQIAPQPPPPPPPQEEAPVIVAAIDTPDIVTDSSVDRSKIVYVTDFELDAVDGQGKLEKSVPAVSVTNPMTSRGQILERNATTEAGRLIDFMAVTLVADLKRAGYSVRRLRPGDSRPTDGIRISGIFAEPDAQNRLRRAVMGTFSPDGKMSLFVGISNLERPEQAFYAPAEPGGANRAGEVITVSSYVPVARFEIGKTTTEKVVRDTAAGVVADLNALLSANMVASR